MPDYKTWRDRGGNIGVQCTTCNRTRWTGNEPVFDPTIGQDCANCVLIKSSQILEGLNADTHLLVDGSSPYPLTQPEQVDQYGVAVSE